MSRVLTKINEYLTRSNIETEYENNIIYLGEGAIIFKDTEECVLFFAPISNVKIPSNKMMDCLSTINYFNRVVFSYLKPMFSVLPSSKDDGYVFCSLVYEIPYNTRNAGESAFAALAEFLECYKRFEEELRDALEY